ncbi:phosphocarrier protein HPr [candidate division KSB3 bacterium]|uniref:Phosphocarrier protein HPr n=1 Tax=candidate division KSB3 bacterium TaxID=2044937 RepID=A0A2G6E7E4_9BACT|nr:MAG: phosphocarrier protein HPr [candidate division KSB3 bacterium]PIE30383.1 MAG: phosphocarrier protein HPr [candidate division KSB3 bacterium]
MAEIRIVTIQNELGLHARAAAQFVQIANTYQADITVEKDGEDVNGKSILNLMMLAAPIGSEIILKAEGDDANEMLASLTRLIDNKFGEAK